MTAKLVLFDFDGTIADTYQAIADITNQLSSEFGYKPVEPEELLLLKNLSSREIIKKTEISLFKIPFLVKRVRNELSKEIAKLKPITGIERVLFQLKARGYSLGIVTSNDKHNVELFLAKNNLNFLFDFIYSSTSIFGKHRVIKRIIKHNQWQREQIVYVGDETRDIRSARKSRIGVVAVSWGFNSAEILAEFQPDFLVDRPQELAATIAACYPANQKQFPVKVTAN
ncbi:HAD-IA family hydrolase [Myxosarcina sp. GI1]|uniref:HAD-IA family hydrolase n=1 Tax=Myxosarcina sp. GI1 TaxID=1541065 RepID=UPI00055D6422|nr:HAD-IA family hydrolase [Myxosarcina sp. GI1]